MSRKNRHTGFGKSFRGYNPEEVDSYVEELHGDVDSLNTKVSELSSKLLSANETIEKYRRTEAVRGDIVAKAKAEAESIVNDAKGRAARIIIRTGRQCNRIVSDMVSQVEEQKNIYETTKREVVRFRSELFELYKDHVKKINAYAEAAGVGETEALTESELDGFIKLLGGEVSDVNDDSAERVEEKLTKIKEETEKSEAELDRAERKIPESVSVKTENEPEDKPVEESGEFEFTEDDEKKDEKGEFELADEKEPVPGIEVDEEDLDEYGREGPLGNVVNEFDGTVAVDDVFGKTASYDDVDFEAVYGGDDVEEEKKSEPTPEELLERRRRAEDDSNEFYREGDEEYESDAALDAPTKEIAIVKQSDIFPKRKKRWKLKRSMSITDEFKAVKYENDEN